MLLFSSGIEVLHRACTLTRDTPKNAENHALFQTCEITLFYGVLYTIDYSMSSPEFSAQYIDTVL